jgi:hypothetical protein
MSVMKVLGWIGKGLGWIGLAFLVLLPIAMLAEAFRRSEFHWHAVPAEAATPQILRGLPAADEDAATEFAARFAARFKNGMREDALVAAMREQGFSVDMESFNPRGGADFIRHEGYCMEKCTIAWSVRWSRGSGGRAHDIQTGFSRFPQVHMGLDL